MSQQIGGYPASPATGSSYGQPTTQVARDEAAEVGRTQVRFAFCKRREVLEEAVERLGRL